MTSFKFIPLRVHTTYSLLEGAMTIDDLASISRIMNIPAVALTDTGNLFGAAEFSRTLSHNGIQPIIGCQLQIESLEEENQDKKLITDKIGNSSSIVLLVQNENGYLNLLRLINKACQVCKPGRDVLVDIKDLDKFSSGLIALSGGLDGEIFNLLLKNKIKQAEIFLDRITSIFQDKFYLEITRFGLPEENQVEGSLIDLSLRKGIPLVATNESFFFNESMYEASRVLLNISDSTDISRKEGTSITKHHRFKAPEEMLEIFSDIPRTCQNTVEIAKRCSFMIEQSFPIPPKFPFKGNFSEKEELTFSARRGLTYRLSHEFSDESLAQVEISKVKKKYHNRLEDELRIIVGMGYSGYYLIVSDLIKWARRKGIPVGPGRGSGAGSLVAWALSITNVDPIKWWLPFERFLNPGRVSMPDFDIDFCQDRRDEIIRYIQSRYGSDCVALISTFGKLQTRAVVRDVGRSLGLPYNFVNKICRFLPSDSTKSPPLREILHKNHGLRSLVLKDEQINKLIEIASKIEGFQRNVSTHAAGVLISDSSLRERIPLYYDSKSGLQVTQLNMKDIEFIGLIKFDFLGLKTLTVIQKTIDQINQRGESVPPLNLISLRDSMTFNLLQKAETVGVFQLESQGIRSVLEKLIPNSFEEIIALIALYRPGPMDHIQQYIACKNRRRAVTYAHPDLENLLRETFGVMVYQEQIMQIAQKIAGYKLGEADILRRSMSKKIPEEMNSQRDKFIRGAHKNGVVSSVADLIFKQMAKFALYGFNKCHACPYALITYQTAYLKANYPFDFMSSLMTHELLSSSGISLYYKELKRMNIKLLQPCINRSFADFSVENIENRLLAIRCSLSAIKNISSESIDFLVRERETRGPFKTVLDFLKRLDTKIINKRTLENLVASGSLDIFNRNRSEIYENVSFLIKLSRKIQDESSCNQLSLLPKFRSLSQDNIDHSDLVYNQGLTNLEQHSHWTKSMILKKEFESTGMCFSVHPLEKYDGVLDDLSLKITNSVEIPDYILNRRSYKNIFLITLGIVIEKKDSRGNDGFFLVMTLSDMYSFYDVKLPHDRYEKYKDKLTVGCCFIFHLSIDSNREKNNQPIILGAVDLKEFGELRE